MGLNPTRWVSLQEETRHTGRSLCEARGCHQTKNAKKCQPRQKLGKRHGTPVPKSLWRENGPAHTVVSDFWSPDLCDDQCLPFVAAWWQLYQTHSHRNGDLAAWMKLRALRWGDSPGFSRGRNVIRAAFLEGARGVREGRCEETRTTEGRGVASQGTQEACGSWTRQGQCFAPTTSGRTPARPTL